jgi:hypothetical protein
LAVFGDAVAGTTDFFAGAFGAGVFLTGGLLVLALLDLATGRLGAATALIGFFTGLAAVLGATLADLTAVCTVFPEGLTALGAALVVAFAAAFTGLVEGALFALGWALPLGADFVTAFMLGLLASDACAPGGADKGALSFAGSPCVIPLLASLFVVFPPAAVADWR